MKLGNRGFTLVELMFSALIFSIIVLSVYSLLNMSNVIFRTNDAYAQINHNGMQILHSISRELRQAGTDSSRLVITTDASNNSVVRFQIPVDYDNDGDVTVSSLSNAVEWGSYDQAGQTQRGAGQNPLDRWAQYSVANNQLIRQVLDSALAPVIGLNRVISNGVQTFTITTNQNTLTMNVTLTATDSAGQAGSGRTFQITSTAQTVLRNAST